MTLTIEHLPAYPSTQSRKRLAPSKLLDLNRKIATTLGHVIGLPSSHQNSDSLWNFVSSYARDTAAQIISGLIWPSNDTDPSSRSKDDGLIYRRALQLAQQLVSNTATKGPSLAKANGLDLQVLVDLAVIYGGSKSTLKGIRSLSENAFTLPGTGETNTSLLREVETDLVPAFTMLLVPVAPSTSATGAASVHQGLYGIRKVSHCVLNFLRVSPPAVVLLFANNREFMLALANTYDQGLATIAHNYGGIRAVYNYAQSHTGNSGGDGNDERDWERLCVESKVALIDAFHILFKTSIDKLTRVAHLNTGSTGAPSLDFAVTLDRTFEILFDLLDIPASSSSNATEVPPTPFLNRPLLADYQQSYSLAKTLAEISHKYEKEKDARLDILEDRLQALGGEGVGRNPGALTIMLRSSGVPPGIDNLGKGPRSTRSDAGASVGAPTVGSTDKGKGKAKTPASAAPVDPDIDIKITQVLDIFGDYAPDYIRALLTHPSYPFRGNPEGVITALLEGTAPSPEELKDQWSVEDPAQYEFKQEDTEEAVFTRENVFDDTPFDMSMFRTGKKRDDDALQDRAYIEQMKADILRRAEEISSDEEEEDTGWAQAPGIAGEPSAAGKGRAPASSFDDDDEDGPGVARVRVLGDGEESSDEDEEELSEARQAKPLSVETILELAYIRDPNDFNRDAQTRRGRARIELREKTGWADEQIEGWRIMLERNPKKDKILAKHEFLINQNHITSTSSTKPARASGSHPPRGGGGRGGRSGRGRGGGRGGTNAVGGGGDASERAWKDKNKASRANHNRKRGHDKKMARAGGPSA
ncbi:hypothetical protein BDN72DRAFT_834632 [Pluteus cervinus]|uniref:Uncharacterized protein n=1 Tax=Pluteus cervinus TaxID=181527 RepID=A0ACD3B626_9AGAR|nr:hypothetical protein BDN72DRAFT_834632 [Pluteus cervinus]